MTDFLTKEKDEALYEKAFLQGFTLENVKK